MERMRGCLVGLLERKLPLVTLLGRLMISLLVRVGIGERQYRLEGTPVVVFIGVIEHI
jgi:hypothetical protein